MSKIFTKVNALLVICLLTFGFIVTSCGDDEDASSEIVLNSYGPSPALRGGDLKFIGLNLDKVSSIVIPGAGEINSFKTKTPSLIVLEVPEAAVDGQVILKTPQGDITPKTMFVISEPITITSISPEEARPGELITINGTYLNLVEEVIFPSNKVVTEFESQSRTAIQVRVPLDAQTGLVVVSNGAEEPIEVESENEFVVTLPTISSLSPNPVKAGATVTISGANLDLAQQLIFAGNKFVAKENFTVSEAGDKITVTVPADAQDGKVKIVAASNVESESAAELVMVMPTITSIAPNPAKTSGDITVKGTNLDVVTSVVFGGDKTGTIVNKTATEMTVTVPADAVAGELTFNTAANKSVTSSAALDYVKPTITSIAPMDVKTQADVTITGTNLDVVSKVIFTGDTEGTIKSKSATQLVVTVPTRSQSGTVKLVTTNGTEVVSTQSLNISAGNVPTISNAPATAKPGQMITITGLKLDLATEVIFPGNIRATTFGAKTATTLEVVVPEKTELGVGRITFITIEGDVTTSPLINFIGDIKTFIYADALSSQWQQWGGWGTALQDFANTEQVYRGSHAIKVNYNDSYGAIQLHPVNATALSGYTHIILHVRGGAADSRGALQVQTAAGDQADAPFNVKAGEYTMIEIPISALGDVSGGINDLRIKNYGTNPNTFYIDDIGLR